MQSKIPDSYFIDESINDKPESFDNPDRVFERQKKRHRNTIELLNHYFRVCTHPFVLMVILVVLGITFSVFHIMSKSTDIKWAFHAAELLGKILSYVATSVFSSIFTWFLENHGKLKENTDT